MVVKSWGEHRSGPDKKNGCKGVAFLGMPRARGAGTIVVPRALSGLDGTERSTLIVFPSKPRHVAGLLL